MPRMKRSSDSIDRANTRHASISSIDPKLDFGNGLSLESYRKEIDEAEQARDEYNRLLSLVDEAKRRFDAAERHLDATSEQIFKAVGVRFGFDSVEYEKAGGIPKSERKRPTRTKEKQAA